MKFYASKNVKRYLFLTNLSDKTPLSERNIIKSTSKYVTNLSDKRYNYA